MLPVFIPPVNRDWFPVEPYFSLFRFIQPHQDLGESGLAAAVAANQEYQLSGFERKIQRTEVELVHRAIVPVAMCDFNQFQSLPRGWWDCNRGRFRRLAAKIHSERVDLLGRNIGPG